jgi:xanthine dehydrogenase small subunit
MRDYLLLYINGKPVRITGDDAFSTLAGFLRRRQQLTGTKIVCAEGDCGACAVLVGRLSPDGESLQYTSENSCIQMMFQLDCTHIITVEGLKYGHELNPIQKSMVACQGTQCGFCTPGFVVSLYDLMHETNGQTSHDVGRALVGNLCRCTGYDSIIRAALSTDRKDLKSIDTLYPPAEIVKALSATDEVEIKTSTAHFFKPTSVASTTKFLAEHESVLIVSGATDVAVQCNKGTRHIQNALSTAAIPNFRDLQLLSAPNNTNSPAPAAHTHLPPPPVSRGRAGEEVTQRPHDGTNRSPRALFVGAGATLTQLEQFTTTHLPELSRFLAYFGSPLIKNAATLAGNLVNASPVGDTIPALFVLGAELELASTQSTRWIDIDDFYTGYRQTVLTRSELLTRIRIPLPEANEIFKLYKVSRRKDLDISSFGAAILMRATNGGITQIRIALGGVAPTVVRLPRTENFLIGKILSEELFDQAGEIAESEITPISDVRASEGYRRTLAANILLKFWHETNSRNSDERAYSGATP